MKEDTRKLPPEVQKEKRRIALKMREKGYSNEEISELLSIHKSTLGRWIKRFKSEGKESAILGKKRGAALGELRTLSRDQEERIRLLMLVKMPEELGLNDALWTRKTVKHLIEKECKIVMPIRTVGEYLKRWNFTPQKPMKRAYERNKDKVEKWLKEDYPAIKNKALKEGGEIHWGDETGIRNHCQHGRGYAPVGKTPIRLVSGKRLKLNMISTLTNQGKVRYMLYEETMTSDLLIEFLKRLIKDAGRKVFLILDNLRVHRSKAVSEWVENKKDKIEIFFLPAYSPDLNPDEYLNCDLKTQIHSKASPKNKNELKSKIRSSMKVIQLDRNRVKKYFKHPCIQYAA